MEKNKEELDVFKIGIYFGIFMSLPIISAIFVNNILIKIIGLIFLSFFICIVGRSFEDTKKIKSFEDTKKNGKSKRTR